MDSVDLYALVLGISFSNLYTGCKPVPQFQNQCWNTSSTFLLYIVQPEWLIQSGNGTNKYKHYSGRLSYKRWQNYISTGFIHYHQLSIS